VGGDGLVEREHLDLGLAQSGRDRLQRGLGGGPDLLLGDGM
jgi:hypothetical protein